MSDVDFDEVLSRMLMQQDAPLPATSFVVDIKQGMRRINREKLRSRILLGSLFALLAIPLQDIGIGLVHVLAITLVPLPAGLVADLLAPINSVGSVLSVILLGLRWMYRRY